MNTLTRPARRVTPAEIDALLDGSGDPDSPFRAALLAELDGLEEFPQAACQVLDAAGLPGHYVPACHGGRLTDYTDLMRLVRAVARRDLTVAVAHGKTLLGAASVWVSGRPDQAAWLGDQIDRGAVVSWALTEPDRGSDLLAGRLSAVRVPEGWRLTGEKLLINNATRGDLICVLARTDPAGGARGFSLFLVDKRRLHAGESRHLPKIRTHGIRGADISGISFADALVPPTALVGGVGQGIEVVLKALQLTRTVCVALSLGAGDTAIRLAVDFVRERQLYGHRMADLPRVRRLLGTSAAALAAAELTSEVAARSVQALTGEMSVVSAVTKAFVPTAVQEALDQLGELLGARGFLTGAYADGMFAKLERDHRIVAIFDGSTAVCRSALINQFPKLARGYPRVADQAGLAAATRPAEHLAELDPARLALISAGGCSLVASLPDAVRETRELVAGGHAPEEMAHLAHRLEQVVAALHADLSAYQPSARAAPAEAYWLAERYELGFAGAACLRWWLGGTPRGKAGRPGQHDLIRVRAGLVYLLDRLGDPGAAADARALDDLADVLLAAGGPRSPATGGHPSLPPPARGAVGAR
jgi:alkylation response protein AidB-like acyl-CoA dehydrogenase